MRTIWVFGITSALSLGGVVAHGVWRAHADEAESTKHRAELADLREELGRLARETDRTTTALRSTRAPAAAVAPRAEEPPEAREQDDGAVEEASVEDSQLDPAEESRARQLEIQDSLEAAFTTESYDAGWAREAQNQAEELVRASLPAGSAVRTLDCRQTLCRVELDHQDLRSHREFVGHFDERMQWTGPAAILYDETVPGKVATIAYLGRQDVPFPTGEQTSL